MVIISCTFPGCEFKTDDLQEAVACTIVQSHVYGHAVLLPLTVSPLAPDRRCFPSIDLAFTMASV